MDDFQNWLVKELRRVHYKWFPRKNALRNARIRRGKYECAHCKNIFGPKEVQVDHIEPVINPSTSFVDWNEYVERLFCKESGYQILCKPCHSKKSNSENALRRENRNG